jgi:DNA-directed RNA polymerase specialized sigma24 family protein
MSNAPQDEFQALMERVRAGCPDAAREMHDLYSDPIRRMVRRRLHQRMRSQYDSIDFLQDVWASFFHTSLEKCAFATPAALVAFLADLAQNKVVDEWRRRLRGQKYNLNGERSLASPRRDEKQERLDPPQRGPTPSQVAIAKEHWERLVDGQPDPYRLMLDMLRQGHTHLEIAEKTGLHPKMIQRLLHKIAKQRNLP